MMTHDDLKKEVAEITEFIHFSVEETDRKLALDFLEKYRDDPVILSLLWEFYSALPEGIEEPVVKVVHVRSKQGAMLLSVSTPENRYLYFVDSGKAAYVCRADEGIDEAEILEFFDYRDGRELVRECKDLQDESFSSQDEEQISRCPVCSAEHGMLHELGCPVEICPWCEGQLTGCDCRFDKLGVNELVDEDQLLSFFELLSEKGRIPYKKEHTLSYPSDSRGIS